MKKKDNTYQKEYESYMQNITEEFVYSQNDYSDFLSDIKSIDWLRINSLTYEEFIDKKINGILPERQQIAEKERLILEKKAKKFLEYYSWEVKIN